MAKPDAAGIVRGLVPCLDNRSLYVAIAMLGATVMPHNLYLHSALVQTRRIGHTIEEKRTACKWNLFDCTVALNGAMFINCAILILAAAVFYRVHQQVDEIQQAYLLLAPLMGTRHCGEAVRRRAVRLRPVVHAYRNPRRTDHHGGLPQHPRAPLAAPPGHARRSPSFPPSS